MKDKDKKWYDAIFGLTMTDKEQDYIRGFLDAYGLLDALNQKLLGKVIVMMRELTRSSRMKGWEEGFIARNKH